MSLAGTVFFMIQLTERIFVPARSVLTAAPTSNHVPAIVGVIIVFIVMILVVTMLLFVWR